MIRQLIWMKIWPRHTKTMVLMTQRHFQPRTHPATASTHTRERALGKAADCSDWNGHVSRGKHDSKIWDSCWSPDPVQSVCFLHINMVVVWYKLENCNANYATAYQRPSTRHTFNSCDLSTAKIGIQDGTGLSSCWKVNKNAIENQSWFLWRNLEEDLFHQLLLMEEICQLIW